MKQLKKLSIIILLIAIVVSGYIIKRALLGYRHSGVAHSFNDIKELDNTHILEIFDSNSIKDKIEFHINRGYIGRSYLTIALKYKTNKKEFVDMVMYGLDYDQRDNNTYYYKNNDEISIVENMDNMSDKEAYLSKMKKNISSYFTSDSLVDSIEGQDYHGYRIFNTSNRYATLDAIFCNRTDIAIVIIQSSFK
jgi:hypothetical protein